MAKPRLILFDIDGTLVTFKGFHLTTYLLRHYFGLEPSKNKDAIGGETYRAVLIKKLRQLGVKDPEHHPKFEKAIRDTNYVKEVQGSKQFKVKKIAHTTRLIKALEKNGYVLGLLTGNPLSAAKLKLQTVNLWKHFKVAAYGIETTERADLVPIAIREANDKLGLTLKRKDILLIGDTMEDIRCAKKAGVRIISFATGSESLTYLKSGKPEAVFKDFRNTKAILKAIEAC